MKITYVAHSTFLIETARARLIIDPFITGNPLAGIKADDVTVDYILCSHGHSDHIGDALGIARRCKAPIIANHEIAEYFGAQGVATHGLNPGGGFNFPFGRVKLTIAHHSSSANEGLNPVYLGSPCGILLQADGKTVYHAGDTALFLDMQLIGQAGIDLAMVPIGDNYTMGIDDAVAALGMLKPKVTVPMHYNTWPPIAVDAGRFAADAAKAGHKVAVLKPGESLSI